MFNIKWIGIIKDGDIKKYQKEELDEQAVKMKMPKSSKEQMIKAIPFLIPAIIVMFLAMVIKTYIAKDIVIKGWGILIGLLIGFILLFVHEFLHAIVYPKKVKKYIGIVKPFTPVALASYPLSKKRFVLMCLLPYILGIIPLICCSSSIFRLFSILITSDSPKAKAFSFVYNVRDWFFLE